MTNPPDWVVEHVYRVRIEYDVPDDYKSGVKGPLTLISDRVRKALSLDKFKELHVSDSSGGPCWSAYWIIEGLDQAIVEAFARLTCREIKRFKKHVIYRNS